MATEIERKFLVKDLEAVRQHSVRSYSIAQGYISSGNGRTVRVRLRDEEAFLTMKGPSLDGGLSRYEWEQPVSPSDARELMLLCELPPIVKTRHIVPFGGHTFEVDEFHEANEGLVVAEVELKSPGEAFDRPQWLGEEVTGQKRYYNASLSALPYSKW